MTDKRGVFIVLRNGIEEWYCRSPIEARIVRGSGLDVKVYEGFAAIDEYSEDDTTLLLEAAHHEVIQALMVGLGARLEGVVAHDQYRPPKKVKAR